MKNLMLLFAVTLLSLTAAAEEPKSDTKLVLSPPLVDIAKVKSFIKPEDAHYSIYVFPVFLRWAGTFVDYPTAVEKCRALNGRVPTVVEAIDLVLRKYEQALIMDENEFQAYQKSKLEKAEQEKSRKLTQAEREELESQPVFKRFTWTENVDGKLVKFGRYVNYDGFKKPERPNLEMSDEDRIAFWTSSGNKLLFQYGFFDISELPGRNNPYASINQIAVRCMTPQQ